MATYSKEFKAEALRLSDEIGVKKQQNSWGSRTSRWRTGEAIGKKSSGRGPK